MRDLIALRKPTSETVAKSKGIYAPEFRIASAPTRCKISRDADVTAGSDNPCPLQEKTADLTGG
jgi:hypothetical protein